jgi:hypothetical protein
VKDASEERCTRCTHSAQQHTGTGTACQARLQQRKLTCACRSLHRPTGTVG